MHRSSLGGAATTGLILFGKAKLGESNDASGTSGTGGGGVVVVVVVTLLVVVGLLVVVVGLLVVVVGLVVVVVVGLLVVDGGRATGSKILDSGTTAGFLPVLFLFPG